MDEQVDILVPPLFSQSNQIKNLSAAYKDGDWVGKFNLWIIQRKPEPAIVYQQRSPQKLWAPNMLDVAAGGQLLAGEHLTDGLREVEEELGRHYEASQLMNLGRKLYVGMNADGSPHHSVIDVYMIEDSTPLSSYVQQVSEVYALCVCPISELLKVFIDKTYSFTAQALTANGESTPQRIEQTRFPENWDNYHYKMALLADRYFKGEKNLIY